MKEKDENLVVSVDIFYICYGTDSIKTVHNNDTLQFTTFFDTLQKIGGEEFVKKYIDEDAVFEGYLITIKLDDKYYSF